MDCEIPIGARFSILHRSFRRRIDELIGEQGLTGVQGFVLCELHRMEMAGLEEINQRDLERATHLSHPTLNEIIKRLEAKGFVSCRVSTRDRRSKCIVSAPMAGEVFRCMDSLDRTVFDELCRGLSEEQTAEFLNTTDIMLKTPWTCTPRNVSAGRDVTAHDKKTCRMRERIQKAHDSHADLYSGRSVYRDLYPVYNRKACEPDKI